MATTEESRLTYTLNNLEESKKENSSIDVIGNSRSNPRSHVCNGQTIILILGEGVGVSKASDIALN